MTETLFDQVDNIASNLARNTDASATANALAGPGASSLPLPTDPTQGWHLNAINVKSVWTEYTGQGVHIGVVDDGIDYTNPDLQPNYNTAYDYNYVTHTADGMVTSISSGHGTKVAGVIAAASNGSGVVGVAYNAQISGFSIGYGSNGNWAQLTSALETAGQTMDVVNSSWGYSTTFSDNFDLGSMASANMALLDGVTTGRGGLGAVFVFAAGNERSSGQDVNYHSFQNSPYTIAVAATDSSGKVASWSDPGAALLVSAPGVSIPTTVGSSGTGSVSGTSFSSPIVSGVVALMLEANPHLGYRDVQKILAMSATQNDATSTGWATNGATNWNGGGMHFNQDYGFGLVDAHAAVRLAESWTEQSTQSNLVSVSSSHTVNSAIPDNNVTGVSDHIAVTQNIDVESVQVQLSITHPHIGDLTVYLTSPDGTTAVLAHQPGGAANAQQNINFTFSANNFMGENSVGAWTLKVVDSQGNNVGTLNSWKLVLNGDAPTADHTYFYTDAYAGFTDAARTTLSDHGGNVTINAAATTGAVNINMNAGTASSIDGNVLHLDSGTVVNTLYLGDGAASVVGSSANDTIFAGRGIETINAGAGTDKVVFMDNISAFNVQVVSANTIIVTYNGTGQHNESTVTMSNVENFQFGNTTYTLSQIEATYGTTQVIDHAPVVAAPIVDQAANQSDAFAFTVPVATFTDSDAGDSLTYSAKLANGNALPSWLTFNAATHTFSGTPTSANAGVVSVAVTATDKSGLSVSDNFNITVTNTDHAPVVAVQIADQTVNQSAAFTFTVPANSFADKDIGDSLTYSAKMANGNALPSWLTFNAATHTFSGTPTSANAGVVSVAVTATDKAGMSVSDSFNITVTNTDHAPVVAVQIADQAVNQSDAFAFTVPTATFTDSDLGDSLTYSAKLANGNALPSWLTFNAATHTFSGTPTSANAGVVSVAVTATDKAGLSVSDSFNITVTNTDHAPVVAVQIADQAVNQSDAFAFTVPTATFSDRDIGDSLTYSAKMANGNALPSWLTFNAATHTFSGTPTSANAGVVSVAVTATDKAGMSVSDSFNITVTNTDHAPVVAVQIADQAVTQNAAFNFTVPVSTFSDRDIGDSLTYSAKLANGNALPSWLTFNAATHTFSGTPGSSDVGAVSVAVTATDRAGLSVSDSFNVTVAAAQTTAVQSPAAPIQNVASVVAGVNTTPVTGAKIGLSDLFHITDANGDATQQVFLYTNGQSTGHWEVNGRQVAASVTITAAQAANTVWVTGTAGTNEKIYLSAYDGHTWSSWGTTGVQSMTGGPNHAPVVALPVADQVINQNAAFNFTVPVATFTDSDVGDSLTYTAKMANGSALPAWLAFNAATHSFSGTPANGDVGLLNVSLTATDHGGLSVTDNFNITVNNVNDAPVVAVQIADQAINQSVAFNFVVPTNTFKDIDLGDSLTYSAKLADGNALPSWLTFNAATHTFSGTPGSSDAGVVNVAVTATDRGGLSVTDSFKVTVSSGSTADNTTTVIAPTHNVASVVAGVNVTPVTTTKIALSDLFHITDANGDATQQVFLYTNDKSTGHWEVNGHQVAASVTITAAQAANTVWVAGTAGTDEKVYLSAYDGHTWSSWGTTDVKASVPVAPASAVSASPSEVGTAVHSLTTSDLIDFSHLASANFHGYVATAAAAAAAHWDVGGVISTDLVTLSPQHYDGTVDHSAQTATQAPTVDHDIQHLSVDEGLHLLGLANQIHHISHIG